MRIGRREREKDAKFMKMEPVLYKANLVHSGCMTWREKKN